MIALLVPLGLASLLFTVILLRSAIAKRAVPSVEGMALGAITNFFDTLGIGSFAPTMAWFKFRSLVADCVHTAEVVARFLALLDLYRAADTTYPLTDGAQAHSMFYSDIKSTPIIGYGKLY